MIEFELHTHHTIKKQFYLKSAWNCNSHDHVVSMWLGTAISMEPTQKSCLCRYCFKALGCLKVTRSMIKSKLLHKTVQMGQWCGLVGRAVTSDSRGPRFESSHRQIHNECFLSTVLKNVVCALVRANLRNALVRNVYTLASIFPFAAWNAVPFESNRYKSSYRGQCCSM